MNHSLSHLFQLNFRFPRTNVLNLSKIYQIHLAERPEEHVTSIAAPTDCPSAELIQFNRGIRFLFLREVFVRADTQEEVHGALDFCGRRASNSFRLSLVHPEFRAEEKTTMTFTWFHSILALFYFSIYFLLSFSRFSKYKRAEKVWRTECFSRMKSSPATTKERRKIRNRPAQTRALLCSAANRSALAAQMGSQDCCFIFAIAAQKLRRKSNKIARFIVDSHLDLGELRPDSRGNWIECGKQTTGKFWTETHRPGRMAIVNASREIKFRLLFISRRILADDWRGRGDASSQKELRLAQNMLFNIFDSVGCWFFMIPRGKTKQNLRRENISLPGRKQQIRIVDESDLHGGVFCPAGKIFASEFNW